MTSTGSAGSPGPLDSMMPSGARALISSAVAKAGMTVTFSPYELGCYAAGTHAFTVSYAFLQPYLSEYGCRLLGLDAPAQ